LLRAAYAPLQRQRYIDGGYAMPMHGDFLRRRVIISLMPPARLSPCFSRAAAVFADMATADDKRAIVIIIERYMRRR